MKLNRRNISVIAIFAISGVFLFLSAIKNPAINWDVIGYVSAALSPEINNSEILHSKTFEDIRSSVTSDQFRELTDANEYRQKVSSDPSSLYQHLPFYSIRYLYNSSVRWASEASPLSLTEATYYLSAFWGALCLFILYFFLARKTFIDAFIAVSIIAYAGVYQTSRLSSPDTMAAFFTLVILLLYFKGRKETILFLTLLPLIRTDFVILSGLIAICEMYKKKFISATSSVVAPLASFYLVNFLNQNYGFLKIFNFTLIKIDPYPANLEIEKTLTPYLQAYFNGATQLVTHRHFVLYVAAFLIWYWKLRFQKNRKNDELIFIVLGFVAIHMAIFPAYFERFFVWNASLAGILILNWSSEYTDRYLNRFNNLIKAHKN